MSHDPELAPWRNLLTGADAGHYDLPPEVVAARHRLARSDDALHAYPPPDAGARRDAFGRSILDSTGDGWPDPADLLTVDRDETARDAWTLAAREAHYIAAAGLRDVLAADPDRIVVEFLRPAHGAAVAAARKHAGLAPLADNPTLRAALSPAQQSKVDELAAATARYTAVRSAWHSLTAVGRQSRNDSDNAFGELRDLPDVWPSYRQRGNDAPWPAAPVAHLCWIAVHAQPWLPTPAEQDERYLEVYGEALEQASRNRFALRGWAAIGGAEW